MVAMVTVSDDESAGRLALTEEDRALLDIESVAWNFAGAKVEAFRDRAGMSEAQAYQRLNQLIDTEAALAYAPHTVKRLLRIRSGRQRSRPTTRII